MRNIYDTGMLELMFPVSVVKTRMHDVLQSKRYKSNVIFNLTNHLPKSVCQPTSQQYRLVISRTNLVSVDSVVKSARKHRIIYPSDDINRIKLFEEFNVADFTNSRVYI